MSGLLDLVLLDGMVFVFVTLEQSDSTHHRDTASQRQEQSQAIMAVKLHFRQEIGKSNKEKGSGRKCQGRTGELSLHALFDGSAREMKGYYSHGHHEREADLN